MAQSRGQERAPIQIQLYVAGRRVKVVSPHSRTAPPLTRRPAPGGIAFRIWRVENYARELCLGSSKPLG